MSDLAIEGGPRAIKEDNDPFVHPQITQADLDAVSKALSDGDISVIDSESTVKQLEERLGDYFGSTPLLHHNGTSALFAAFFSLGQGSNPRDSLTGCEVICPTYAWWATIAPVIALGGTPVFCDIDESSLAIDFDDLAEKVTDRTAAIVIPYMWSEPSDLKALQEIANTHNIAIVEDASHAWGATYDGNKVGTLFDISALSLQAGKPLPAGEGGLLLTDNDELYQRAVAMGHYRRVSENSDYSPYKKTGLGYKFRISALNAALANSQFERFQSRIETERKLAAEFHKELKSVPGISLVRNELQNYERGGFFQYRLQLTSDFEDRRDYIIEALQKEGVPATQEYVPLLHQEPFFESHSRGTEIETASEIHPRLIGHDAFRRGDRALVQRYVDAIEKVISSCR